ncbi:MAG: hypothetical protein JXN61_06550 [Sedimentisphaerales bacterium]|nr:hypothetical protein [Sedimentisphaerales bacterium]
MKNAAVFPAIAAALPGPVFADSRARPVEQDYYSGNRQFVGHVTPAKEDAKAEPTIIVRAGRTTEGIEIDCTEKVASGAD